MKKDKADWKLKAKTHISSDVVKGLKIENELETTNLDNSGNESKTTDSGEMFDLEELDQLKATQTRRQRKSTPTQRN